MGQEHPGPKTVKELLRIKYKVRLKIKYKEPLQIKLSLNCIHIRIEALALAQEERVLSK